MALSTSKSALRKEITAKINQLSMEERARQSDVVQKAILSHKAFKEAKHISVYLSLSKEVSTKRIVEAILADPHKTLYVPDIIHGAEEARMEMLQVHSMEDLSHFEAKELNVKCPTHDVERANPLAGAGEGLDLIILPGVAFTKKGGRMGRGKGYYDKYIRRLREFHSEIGKDMPRLIAIAFDEQVLDDIPVGEFDEHVDHVFHASAL